MRGFGGGGSQAYTLTVQADNMLRSVIEVHLTTVVLNIVTKTCSPRFCVTFIVSYMICECVNSLDGLFYRCTIQGRYTMMTLCALLISVLCLISVANHSFLSTEFFKNCCYVWQLLLYINIYIYYHIPLVCNGHVLGYSNSANFLN